jgi:hypothetical protein
MVELAVAGRVEPMTDPRPAGRLDRRGRVVTSVVIVRRKPTNITGVPDQQRSHDRSHAVHLGHGRTAGRHRHLDPRLGRDELSVESADIAEQLFGQRPALGSDLTGGTDAA